MTSKFTRARLEEIRDYDTCVTLEESAELARMALAAMDSEPVFTLEVSQAGYKGQKLGNHFGFITLDAARNLKEGNYQLYRHAQPAPVVPDEMTKSLASIAKEYQTTPQNALFIVVGWNACRAAMLQAQSDDDGEPTDDERIMAIEGIHNCERCGDEGWVVGEMGITRCACGQAAPVCTCPSGDGSLRWPCPSHPGKSPVIPEGYVMVPKEPTERMVIDGFESEPDETFSEPEVWEEYQKMSGCEQAAFRARLCWAAMIASAL